MHYLLESIYEFFLQSIPVAIIRTPAENRLKFVHSQKFSIGIGWNLPGKCSKNHAGVQSINDVFHIVVKVENVQNGS
jgi:hypothetical protein